MSTSALKVGLIGAGAVARGHLRAYRQFPALLKLVALCEVNEALARERAVEFGVEHSYTDAQKMLEQADIDAVDICTSHDMHAPLAIAAAKAGKHVLVEKPLGCTQQECYDIVRAAEQAGVVLMVAQNQRYNPHYRAVHQLLQAGTIGKIHAVRLDVMQNLRAFVSRGHWFYDGIYAGGGVAINAAIHKIDLLRYFIGDVKRVSAVRRTMRPEFINGAEDHICALLEFENGAIGDLFATYAGFRMPWSESFMIFGDHGTIHAIPPEKAATGSAFIASLTTCSEAQSWNEQFCDFMPIAPDYTELSSSDSMVNELLHFHECCQTGKAPLSSGRDNLGTMDVIFAIYQSAHSARPVEIASPQKEALDLCID